MGKSHKIKNTISAPMNKIITFSILFAVFWMYPIGACAQMGGEPKEYYKMPLDDDSISVHPTKYDWTSFAEKVTAGCSSNYDKIRAIYEWICRNISYDTSYSIHTADSCVEAKKGVCQGYCELFYQIAKAADVRVEIVSGKSKDREGNVSDLGHAWLFAYVRDNYGILLDPTWGAGTVDNNVFTRSQNCWDWFGVDAELMILSHYPDQPEYQLIDDSMSFEEFLAVQCVSELWIKYGLNVHQLYMKARAQELDMPEVFTQGEGEIELLELPLTSSLRIGEVYLFRVRVKSGREIGIINNKVYSTKDEWTREGYGVFRNDFMPRDTESLCIGLKQETDNKWDVLVRYRIEQPTDEDWGKVEAVYPLAIPEIKNVKHLNAKEWNLSGIDNHRLQRLIKEQKVKDLPAINHEKGQKFRIVEVPMHRQLKCGREYMFRFYPQSGIKWAIVNNDNWHKDWLVAADGMHSMRVSPTENGKLVLYVQLKDNDFYYSCLEYEVIP